MYPFSALTALSLILTWAGMCLAMAEKLPSVRVCLPVCLVLPRLVDCFSGYFNWRCCWLWICCPRDGRTDDSANRNGWANGMECVSFLSSCFALLDCVFIVGPRLFNQDQLFAVCVCDCCRGCRCLGYCDSSCLLARFCCTPQCERFLIFVDFMISFFRRLNQFPGGCFSAMYVVPFCWCSHQSSLVESALDSSIRVLSLARFSVFSKFSLEE